MIVDVILAVSCVRVHIGHPVRPKSAGVASIIGFTGGFMYIYQNASARLMGFTDPN
jgi:biotin transporter BioY